MLSGIVTETKLSYAAKAESAIRVTAYSIPSFDTVVGMFKQPELALTSLRAIPDISAVLGITQSVYWIPPDSNWMLVNVKVPVIETSCFGITFGMSLHPEKV